MKTFRTILTALSAALIMCSCTRPVDKVDATDSQFVIEREIPGAGKLTFEELKAASQKSCEVLRQLGPQIKWLHSYVTADKVYCVYVAPSKELIVKHAQLVGVPANQINEVSSVINPATAE